MDLCCLLLPVLNKYNDDDEDINDDKELFLQQQSHMFLTCVLFYPSSVIMGIMTVMIIIKRSI